MSLQSNLEPMLELFYFETTQYLVELEQLILNYEKSASYNNTTIDEIFRIMHNIKSASAMMLFNHISTLAHTIEDLFFFLREQRPPAVDYGTLSDLVLAAADFIKIELDKIKNEDVPNGDNSILIGNIKDFLALLHEDNQIMASPTTQVNQPTKEQYYISKDTSDTFPALNFFKTTLFFQDGCEMENIRAYALVHHLQEIAQVIHYIPEDVMENDDSVAIIKEQGFKLWFKTNREYLEIQHFFDHTAFVRDLDLVLLENDAELKQFEPQNRLRADEIISGPEKMSELKDTAEKYAYGHSPQSLISVNVNKLDMLMDLVGEMVIAEAMVTNNPDLKELQLDNFKKAALQLRKITSEVQDVVMSIRMVPLTITLQKMNRIVRDMAKKLNKNVVLEIIGAETEVDKNIIEHISDPLMHLVRNAIDHGIENNEERIKIGKTEPAKVVIEAKSAGNDVLIIVKDNGQGLDQEKILKRARENGLLYKPENELSEKEIFSLVFLPGFSTEEKVTEFSGRGVGMDVVTKNIETLGGSVLIDSTPGEGTAVTLKIPLTLAIISGMNVKVGSSSYTIPITSIKESFRPKENEIITDPEGHEMVMLRGECYPIIRLHERFKVKTNITVFTEGIIIMIENGEKTYGLFVDGLLGEQQVVVKALPNYIRKIKGLAGCTLLGDGSISLILDMAGLIEDK